jgi:hypothetical protein
MDTRTMSIESIPVLPNLGNGSDKIVFSLGNRINLWLQRLKVL